MKMGIVSKLKTWLPHIGMGIVAVFASPRPGWSSVWRNVELGQNDMALQSLVDSFTGVGIGGIGGQDRTSFDMGKTLNPLDFERAPAPKTAGWIRISMEAIDAIQGLIYDVFKELKG